MIVLDTNIVIYLLEGRLAELPEADELHVSVISEIELLSYNNLDSAGESAIRAFLGSTQVVDLTEKVKETAILLRRRHRLTIPDALIAATAQSLGAVLLTNDAKLLGLPDVASRSLTLKPA